MSLNGKKSKGPVEISLSDQHKKGRLIAVIVLLAVGLSALGYGIYRMIQPKPGWQTVETNCDEINVGQDFVLQYYFSGGNTERRQVMQLYTQGVQDAYWIFTADQSPLAYANLHTLNHHPNEPQQVKPELYQAIKMLEPGRLLYLGPVYQEYSNLFFSETDEDARNYDPRFSQETRKYVEDILKFAKDSKHIQLELGDNNQVTLHVSPEYLAFAEEYEMDRFLDLSYMKNAFITDYLAEILLDAGLNHGVLSSFDGYTRNMMGEHFSVNLFDYRDTVVYPAGIMPYEGPMNLVNLRGFPTSAADRYHYYVPREGEVVTPFVSPENGLTHTGTSSLLSYSQEKSCGQILLEILPAFLDEDLNAELLGTLKEIDSVWCEGQTVYHTQPDLKIQELLQTEKGSYESKLFKNS